MMSRRGLHLGHVSSADPSQVDVVESYFKAHGFLEVAMELWRLAGRADRADAILDLLASSRDHEPRRLERPQIVALRNLLDGLEQALVGALTDDQHMLSKEKVEELRGHTDTLDLADTFGPIERDPRYAVQEALIYVDHLRTIADEALARGASILFD